MTEYTLTHRNPPLQLPCEGEFFDIRVDAGVLLVSPDDPNVGWGSRNVRAGRTATFTTSIWVRARSWVRFFVLTEEDYAELVERPKGWARVKSILGRKD
jgi:hypothetical protein